MQQTAPKQEPMLPSIIFNVLLPVVLLQKGPGFLPGALGTPAGVLSIALAFPIIYGLWDFNRRRQLSFIAIFGFISVLLTGGIGLLQLPRFWYVVKEGAIPFIIGLVVWATCFTKKPLAKVLLLNNAVVDVPRIEGTLAQNNAQAAFTTLLKRATFYVALSFFASGVLQWILASSIVTAEPALQPELFNQQVGQMTWVSYLVVMLPSMAITAWALWLLFSGLKRLTGLKFDEVLREL